MRKLAATSMLIFALSGCSSAAELEADVDRALRNFGFANGRNYVRCFLCCSKDDIYRFVWTAENRDGRTVTGQACSGFFKGWTVRVD